MRGLIEVDVTLPRQIIREHKAQTGEKLSFTAFLTRCVAQAIGADKQIQAMTNWKGNLVIFDDVDISILIEQEKNGKKYPLAHVIRGADKKTLRDIHEETRQVQAKPYSDEESRSLKVVVSLPRFLRRLMLWIVSKSLHMRKQNLGTITISPIGMFGNVTGWPISPNFHPLA